MDGNFYATQIVRKLVDAGYIAYFAGGWVRDYLMGHPSDDIDIATNATPDVIVGLFPRTLLVGIAFGVVVVLVNGHQFEVSTFRRDVNYVNGRTPEKIELATPLEDASRRDFTINGLFYDPLEGVVHDFLRGAADIKNKLIKAIGDPYERFFEDRLRMIRAVRFAARFGFAIDYDTQEAIRANADTLFPAVAMERIWQEFVKMSKYPNFSVALVEMHRLGLLPTIFPNLQGVHLHVIKDYVAHFRDYLDGTATVVYLMALFPQATAGEAEETCRYLRTSRADAALAKLLVTGRLLTATEDQDKCDMVGWVHFYAAPLFQQCLWAIAAALPDRQVFLEKHRQRQLRMASHIARVVARKPLIDAAFLQRHGIVPGRVMGNLLKEAESLTISNCLDDPEVVLEMLKKSEIWQKQTVI